MHVIMRKLYMSILASMLVLITTVVTTYAWAGIQDRATTEKFHINLDKNPEADYSLQISLDGINFSEFLSSIDIKRSILKNMEYSSEIDDLDDDNIVEIFEDLRLHSVSTQRKGNELGSFVYLEDIKEPGYQYDFYAEESLTAKRSHFEFDLYLSYKYKDDSQGATVINKKHSIYLANTNQILTGEDKTVSLSNPFQFKNHFPGIIFNSVTVNSASAARVAMFIYPTVDKGNVRDYDGVFAKSLTIYQGGTSTPSFYNGAYSFGGLLTAEDNIGFLQYNELHRPIISDQLLDNFIINRGDEIPLASVSDKWIITEDDGLTVEKMIKIKIIMWVEGFDADCFKVISNLPIDLNLTFANTAS